jgi:hypothetical protein
VVLNATVLSGHTYQWRKDGANISGATTNSYTATATGNYYCVLTNTTTGCSSATSNSIGINATGINATVTPTGTWYKCTGQPVLLTANTGTGLTYQWRSNNINIAGATTSTYTVTTAGNYTVAVTGTCGTSVSAITSVNYTTSLPSGNINTLNTTICSGSTGSMSVYSTLGYSYQWKLNGAAISGAISYLYTTTVAGSYTCTITNACGSYTTPAVVLTTGTLTTATITAGGPVSFCPGGSVVLSSNTGTGYTYQWYNNGALISGATSSSYTATIGGTYACKITSGTCNLTSNLINVTVTGPVAVITPAGSTTICSGTSVTLNTTAGATSYQWKRNNVNLSGATSASFTTSTAGSYTVVVTSSCGSATSAPLVISVINNPTPTITAIGPTTFCAGQSVTFTANTFTGVTYQWQKNSTNISGAVAQSYVANAAGTYRVQETANGCSKYSSTKTVIVNCRLADATANTTEEKNSLGNLNIYPNPNNGYFIVEYSLLNNTESTLVVADITGKIIFNTLLSQGSAKQNISLPFLEEGVYNCVVTQGNVKANKKLVVIKK